ncbi:MAG TPA: tetratricopeptide repeat protein [Firmicutes bacterium]|nr:tetratricopeptide repeat protein [Bacillota bacterium]
MRRGDRWWNGAVLVALLVGAIGLVTWPGAAAGGATPLERGLLYLQMGLPELALAELEKADDAAGEAAGLLESLVLRGLLAQALGRPEQADAALAAAEEHAAAAGPAGLSAAVVETFRARALAERGETDRAMALYRKAVAADGSLGLARLGLAELLEKEGRTAEAITEYRSFLALSPGDPEALAALDRLSGR